MSPQPAPTSDGWFARTRRKPAYLLWIAAAAAVAAISGAFLWNSRVLAIQAVVVRPFTAKGGPPWLAGAITEEIIDALRPVMRPTAEPAFTAVLEGAVSRSGGRLRVTSQLTRGDGHRYWTRTFERPITDLAMDVAAAISPAARKRAPRHKPSAAAYERYLEARQAFDRKEFAGAVGGFEAATQSDPDFALAWARLSIAKEYLAEQGVERPNELMPGARDAAERSVALAPTLAEAHLALGIVRLQYDWAWEDARRELDRALELSPGQPLAVQWRQRWLEAMNRAPAQPVELPNVPRDPDSARRLLADADDLRSRSYISPVMFALAANVARDTDSLFRWLDVAYEERSAQLPYLLRNPALPQSDPRLLDLIRRLKLPTKQ